MEKTAGEQLKERLFYTPKSAYELLSDEEVEKGYAFCEGYKSFISAAKTEREAVIEAVRLAKLEGFSEYDRSKEFKAGDRVYVVNRGKAAIFAVIGSRPLAEGINLSVAHIDSPRLDLKQRPLYEEAETAYFKTHYYGGIKKYQWLALPLALHGVIAKKDGSVIPVNIGEDANDPVFCINDLLPHLAKDQMSKPMSEGVAGEGLNVLVGSRPFKDDKASEKVKLNILNMLSQKYGVTEADFLSAELVFVPAEKARDVGLDRSFIGAYGHDDRVCAYTSLMGLFDAKNPEKTAVCILADKEEIGSEGNTGMQGRYLLSFIEELCEKQNARARDVLSQSRCLSADVNVAFDPNFPDVTEKNNTAYACRGVAITKYTGSRGKYDTNDASAELLAFVRRLLDENNVVWQTGELGKVDQGGGGTVAKYVANLDVNVVDIGVPVLSMHSPFEVVSKMDVYMAYRAFSVFNRSV